MTSKRFTLGIEEEYQLIDKYTGELCSRAPEILEKGEAEFGEHIKPEMLQSTVELVSPVLPDIRAARKELYRMRALLVEHVDREGMALISAGTHPSSDWQNQLSSEGERYVELAHEYRDVVRSDLIFGLHVHVGISDKALMIKVLNQVRTWLPHLVALSANSPFWVGRMSGMKCYRLVQWKRFPRSGIPFVLSSWEDFDRYVQNLVEMGAIDDGKKVWWDVRPHAFFGTLEFRICDMPSTMEDTLAIAALCQAMVAKLALLNEQDCEQPIIEAPYIDENKWAAMRDGLNATIYDFSRKQRVGMRDAIKDLLVFVDDVVDELGSRQEIEHLYALLEDARGNGADQQMEIYERTGDVHEVTRFLREQTLAGLAPRSRASTMPGR